MEATRGLRPRFRADGLTGVFRSAKGRGAGISTGTGLEPILEWEIERQEAASMRLSRGAARNGKKEDRQCSDSDLIQSRRGRHLEDALLGGDAQVKKSNQQPEADGGVAASYSASDRSPCC